MKTYRMQNFHFKYLWILIIGISSCNYATKKQYIVLDYPIDSITNDYFSNTDKDYVYKAKLEVKDNKFGGLLIIKKINTAEHRVVFTTEFGNTIFDFNLNKDGYYVNSILEQIDKKILIKILARDFRTLVQENNVVEEVFEYESNKVFLTKTKKRVNYITTFDENTNFKKIISTKRGKERTVTNYKNTSTGIPQEIEIIHQDYKVAIRLFYIGK